MSKGLHLDLLTMHFKRFFDFCRSRIGKSIRYLYQDIIHENPIYLPAGWQIFTSAHVLSLIDKGVVEDR